MQVPSRQKWVCGWVGGWSGVGWGSTSKQWVDGPRLLLLQRLKCPVTVNHCSGSDNVFSNKKALRPHAVAWCCCGPATLLVSANGDSLASRVATQDQQTVLPSHCDCLKLAVTCMMLWTRHTRRGHICVAVRRFLSCCPASFGLPSNKCMKNGLTNRYERNSSSVHPSPAYQTGKSTATWSDNALAPVHSRFEVQVKHNWSYAASARASVLIQAIIDPTRTVIWYRKALTQRQR